VEKYTYRLFCTNGMSMPDATLKIDARGETVEDVINQLEEMAQRAFGEVEGDIAAFYDLRNVAVDNPEREIRRIVREAKLPDRTLREMIDRVESDDLPDDPSMFDIINVVTNMANNPLIRNKTGARRALETVGGNIVVDHAARCGHCRSRLN
jgi:hypothetical protein